DDPLQLDRRRHLKGFQPLPRCPGQALMAAITLTGLVRQDIALVDEIGIEQEHILAPRPFPWVPRLKEGSKLLQVLLRHRLLLQAGGFEGFAVIEISSDPPDLSVAKIEYLAHRRIDQSAAARS